MYSWGIICVDATGVLHSRRIHTIITRRPRLDAQKRFAAIIMGRIVAFSGGQRVKSMNKSLLIMSMTNCD